MTGVQTCALPIYLAIQSEVNFDTNYNEDAVMLATDTLVSLGISKNEAYMLARANAGDNATAEEIISKSLRGYRA